MKHHMMIALGILLGILFSYRLALALLSPGLGGVEAYLAGGLLIASLLILNGLKERRDAR